MRSAGEREGASVGGGRRVGETVEEEKVEELEEGERGTG